MFIFYFLGVGPPCHSILCQFWLCEEAQCVYLRHHLGSRTWCILKTASLVGLDKNCVLAMIREERTGRVPNMGLSLVCYGNRFGLDPESGGKPLKIFKP